MKKLFEVYQKKTFWFLILFLYAGAKLTMFAGLQFGLIAAFVVGLPIFGFSVMTMVLCLLWIFSDWEVPRQWAMYAISVASVFSTVTMGALLLSAFVDMRWFFAFLRGDVYMLIGLICLAAYILDRIQHMREASY